MQSVVLSVSSVLKIFAESDQIHVCMAQMVSPGVHKHLYDFAFSGFPPSEKIPTTFGSLEPLLFGPPTRKVGH